MSDFNWDEYLEENGTLSVPHHAFKHVSLPVVLSQPLCCKRNICASIVAGIPLHCYYSGLKFNLVVDIMKLCVSFRLLLV